MSISSSSLQTVKQCGGEASFLSRVLARAGLLEGVRVLSLLDVNNCLFCLV